MAAPSAPAMAPSGAVPSGRRRRLASAAGLVALGALVLPAVAVPGSAAPLPARPAPRAAAVAPAAIPMTRIVVTVKKCEGCTIRAARFYISGARTISARYIATAKVRRGVAVLRVPTRTTVGMAFEVHTPNNAGNGNAVPVVTLRFARTKAGAAVTAKAAMRSRSGSWCWAGTSRASIALPLGIYRWTVTRPGPDQGPNVALWSTVMRPVLGGTYGPTYRGGMGHQDAPYCQTA